MTWPRNQAPLKSKKVIVGETPAYSNKKDNVNPKD
jgi:hypothetical protein